MTVEERLAKIEQVVSDFRESPCCVRTTRLEDRRQDTDKLVQENLRLREEIIRVSCERTDLLQKIHKIKQRVRYMRECRYDYKDVFSESESEED